MTFNKRGYTDDSYENDNWNVAKGYTKDITLEHILDLRKFERIARYGVFEFESQYSIQLEIKIDARLKGINWYADELDSLIADNIFAIKPARKDDKELLENFRDDITILKNAIPFSKRETVQRDKKNVEIDELVFGKVLDFLIKIKIKTLEALNRSDLIFKGIDEFDPEKIKDELLQELINTG